jgi:hypothetical protein
MLDVQSIHIMCTVASANVKSSRDERREETGSRHEVTWSLLLSNLKDYIRCEYVWSIAIYSSGQKKSFCSLLQKKKRRSLTRYHEQRSPGASMSYRRVFSDEIAFAAYQQDSGGIQGPFGILGAFE